MKSYQSEVFNKTIISFTLGGYEMIMFSSHIQRTLVE